MPFIIRQLTSGVTMTPPECSLRLYGWDNGIPEMADPGSVTRCKGLS